MHPPPNSRLAATILPLMVAALAAAGCQYPQAVRTYEYVTAYDRMSGEHDPVLSLVYVPERTAFRRYRGVVVGEVDVGRQWVETPGEALRYAVFFRVMLRVKLAELGKFELVTLDVDEAAASGIPPGEMLLVEGRVTKFDTGSGLLRYLTGLLFVLQSGATDLQIEGRLVAGDTGRLVMEFVDRRRHFCNTAFGANPRTLHKEYAMKVTAAETAECIARFIGEHYVSLPAIGVGAAETASRDVAGEGTL